MLDDVRLGWRKLRQQPGFTIVAILTLALGIGATSAVFSLVQGVLLTPPPNREPDRLVLIQPAPTEGREVNPRRWAAPQWTEWQRDAKSFEAFAGYRWAFNFMVLDEGSESLEGMFVGTDYFKVAGLEPVLGRTFSETEASFPTAPVIVIGYDLWQRKFGGDPNIIGTTIRMSRRNTPPTIIGVMPPGVRFLPSPATAQEPNYNVNALVDFWMPFAANPQQLKAPMWDVVGRLRDGATIDQARAELEVIAARQAKADPDFDKMTPQLQALTDNFNGDARRILLPLFGAAALVLLIACGNVAALLLVRGLHRQDEYAVRTALGVRRLALFRQVTIESLLLALIGSALGVGLALGIVRMFKLIAGPAIPRLDAVTTVWPVLVSGLAVALLGAAVAGLLPALRASRLDAMSVIKSAGPKSSAGRGERRLLRAVTVGQTALTLALLMGAGLLLRTTSNLAQVDSGYNTGQILNMTVTAVQGDWNAFHARALEQVAAIPGVEGAAFAWGVPLTGNNWPGIFEFEGQPPVARPTDAAALPVRSVTPGYFNILRMPIAEGRDFRDSDKRDSPSVAIVNRALAERYFPGTSPIGKKLWRFGGRQQPPTEIIGVVANSRTGDLTKPPEPEIYMSLWQASAFSKDLVVRTTAEPRIVMADVQRALRGVDATVAVENMKTLDQVRADSVATRTFATQLLVGFAIVASILTLVGVYGVLSLSVASRRREIAVRGAIGAQGHHIRQLVFSDAFRLIAGGVLAGVIVAVALSRALATFLFGVESTDPATLISVGMLFAVVALLACWLPTHRAAQIDPIEALRSE